MRKLDSIFEESPKVEEAFEYAKEKYIDADLTQHNWEPVPGA